MSWLPFVFFLFAVASFVGLVLGLKNESERSRKYDEWIDEELRDLARVEALAEDRRRRQIGWARRAAKRERKL